MFCQWNLSLSSLENFIFYGNIWERISVFAPRLHPIQFKMVEKPRNDLYIVPARNHYAFYACGTKPAGNERKNTREDWDGRVLRLCSFASEIDHLNWARCAKFSTHFPRDLRGLAGPKIPKLWIYTVHISWKSQGATPAKMPQPKYWLFFNTTNNIFINLH